MHLEAQIYKNGICLYWAMHLSSGRTVEMNVNLA